MNQIIKDLCKARGMLDGEIRTSPMSNQNEVDELEKLLMAKLSIKEAIQNIISFKDVATKKRKEALL